MSINMENITVRYALREELEAVNRIRRQVNDVHVNGRPDIFRADAWEHIRDIVYKRFEDEDSGVIAAFWGEELVGYAQVQYIHRSASPYNRERRLYHIEEFGVDEKHRRMGVATALIQFARQDAREKGFPKLELDMWQFNEGALAFYEAMSFVTFRRYMECFVEEENGRKENE
ncbi:MAG: GNAT family N-acetyltransferase [Lachnospiraceae bacterium]|nr:GNAT family N-acetyltransferase [Lachnospiraceae bacterium]